MTEAELDDVVDRWRDAGVAYGGSVEADSTRARPAPPA